MFDNIESKLIEYMKVDDMSAVFQNLNTESESMDVIKNIEVEIDSLSDDDVNEWADTFLKVGKEYFEPDVYDEASLILESKLGMNIQDYMLLKLREEM